MSEVARPEQRDHDTSRPHAPILLTPKRLGLSIIWPQNPRTPIPAPRAESQAGEHSLIQLGDRPAPPNEHPPLRSIAARPN